MLKDQVLEALKGAAEPMKAAEVATKISQDKAQVDKAIKELVKEDKAFSPKRCYWAAK